MCFTDDEKLYDIMKSLRVHGKGTSKYDNVRTGINGRLDTLQAAVLLAKFEIFAEEVALRQTVADRYHQLLSGLKTIALPEVPAGVKSVWAQYSILAKDETHRSQLQAELKEADIPTAVYYPKPLHMQTAYAFLDYKEGAFAISEDCSRRIFSLPMHPYLEEKDQTKIAEIIITNKFERT